MGIVNLTRIESYFPVCIEFKEWFRTTYPKGNAPLKNVLESCKVTWLEYVCEVLEKEYNFKSIRWIDLYRSYVDNELSFDEYKKD